MLKPLYKLKDPSYGTYVFLTDEIKDGMPLIKEAIESAPESGVFCQDKLLNLLSTTGDILKDASRGIAVSTEVYVERVVILENTYEALRNVIIPCVGRFSDEGADLSDQKLEAYIRLSNKLCYAAFLIDVLLSDPITKKPFDPRRSFEVGVLITHIRMAAEGLFGLLKTETEENVSND